MTTDEHEIIQSLLGSYVLDAVDSQDRQSVEEHLEGCSSCGDEVRDLYEVAAKLGNSGGNAPSDLWDSIEARLDRPANATARPLVKMVFAEEHTDVEAIASSGVIVPLRTRFVRPALGAIAAAAIGATVFFGIQAGRLSHRVDQLQAVGTTSITSALLTPNASQTPLTANTAHAQTMADVVSLPSGSAYFHNDRLAPVSETETYQLWGEVSGKLISMGILGNDPKNVAFHEDPEAKIATYAVTIEQAGGVIQSTHQPVAES